MEKKQNQKRDKKGHETRDKRNEKDSQSSQCSPYKLNFLTNPDFNSTVSVFFHSITKPTQHTTRNP